MKKLLIFCSSLIIMLSISVSIALGEEIHTTPTDSYIYDLIDAYEKGVFKERNDLPELDIKQFFASQSLDSEKSTYNIYDNRQVEKDTYVASRISFYDLDKSDQNEQNGVTIYVAIEYAKKDFGDPYDYVMLNKIKGGVVRQTGNVSCSSLSFRYSVSGDAYNADGSRVGLRGDTVTYNGELRNPIIGNTYYISGPQDYYYSMGGNRKFHCWYDACNSF